MYYVIVFIACIVVIGVLVVLRALASPAQYDEPGQLEQSGPKAVDTKPLQAKSNHEVLEEQERPPIERNA
jgi:hypothetical protein